MSSSDVRMEFDDDFFPSLGHSDALTAICLEKIEQAKTYAVEHAPVDKGDYQRSIHVETRAGKSRTTARLEADDNQSIFVESRTGNLARALNSVRKE